MPEHTRSLPPDEIAERLQTFSQSRESVNDLVGGPAVQAQAPPQQRSPFEAHSQVHPQAGKPRGVSAAASASCGHQAWKNDPVALLQTPHVHYDEADAEQQSEPPHPKKARPSLARAPSAFQENQRYRSMRFRYASCCTDPPRARATCEQVRLRIDRGPCREKPGAVFTARDEANLINIPKNFQAKKGTALTDRLQIGDHISSGLQACPARRCSCSPADQLALQQPQPSLWSCRVGCTA